MDKIIEINHLQKNFGRNEVLKDINFSVSKGEVVCIIGASGSGKSTLLRCINLLEYPTAGEILYHGQNILQHKMTTAVYRAKMGMVFQQFNLVKNLSVLTNVLTGRLGYHGALSGFNSTDLETAYRNLERVGLKEMARRQVKQLSGGQQQRVGIARALMQEPQIVLADEPVASLDPATADSIMQYLGEINREGITVICSLHFLSLARRYGNRVLALKDGKVVFEGLPNQIDNERFKQIYGQDAEEI